MMRMFSLFVLAISMVALMPSADTRLSAMNPPPVPNPAPSGGGNPVGKTEITIGNPQYLGDPPISVTVPITMEIDSTTKGFVGIKVIVTDTQPVNNGHVPVGLTLAPPPQPGKGPVTINANFPVEKGVQYRIEATMRFINAMNQEGSISDMKKITP